MYMMKEIKRWIETRYSHLTQHEIANRLGISQPIIQRILKGKEPPDLRVSTIEKMFPNASIVLNPVDSGNLCIKFINNFAATVEHEILYCDESIPAEARIKVCKILDARLKSYQKEIDTAFPLKQKPES